ncbi:MAG: hypothetical protein IOD12_04620 [Silvanigrellales bacterium]|nr:hypothetical protein [Silvanigrellales bacterium]
MKGLVCSLKRLAPQRAVASSGVGIIALFSLNACTGKVTPPGVDDATSQEISVTLTPREAFKDSDLRCVVGASPTSGASRGSFVYEWRRNGSVIANETGARLGGGKFSKGDKLECAALPVFDSSSQGEFVRSNLVVVKNSPPSG